MEAGNQVDVQMRHRLPCGRAIVDPYVKAVGPKLRLCSCLGLVQQFEQRRSFFGVFLEEGLHVSLGNDQAVAWRDRKAVSDPDGMCVLPQNARFGQRTESALVIGHEGSRNQASEGGSEVNRFQVKLFGKLPLQDVELRLSPELEDAVKVKGIFHLRSEVQFVAADDEG